MAVKVGVGGVQRELSSMQVGVGGVNRSLSSWQGCVGGVNRELLKIPEYKIQLESAKGEIYGSYETTSYDFLAGGHITWGTLFGEAALVVKGVQSMHGGQFELKVNYSSDLWGEVIDLYAETTPYTLGDSAPNFSMGFNDVTLNAGNGFSGGGSVQVPSITGGSLSGTLFSFGWGAETPSVDYQTYIILSCNGRVITPY